MLHDKLHTCHNMRKNQILEKQLNNLVHNLYLIQFWVQIFTVQRSNSYFEYSAKFEILVLRRSKHNNLQKDDICNMKKHSVSASAGK
ncbi:hypothetical protein CANARDRAFT_123237 [[Candida] arabinofermentans NRRL YB-2248]|uniref:Uncharacterized protein n=1 Tax=[Candida] arabinofermentans NRRL YB-2248 TaxID=983967 RepID=A0A1E4ST18_9ASCO|nr:hypothetical protein CANARDRAFT_123237 [[Candida] arabinofermentans NRRL YB-2248]